MDTDSAYAVTAIYDGRVVSILEQDSLYSLLTNTGDYYIYYCNLTKPYFNKGDKICAGQPIAFLSKDPSEEMYTLEVTLLKNGRV
jgi:hypothetical protein